MRYFALILSLYVFIQVSVPCADGTDNCSIVKTEQSTNSSTHDDMNTTHDCSPFCICSCCHSNITLCFYEELISPIIQFEHTISTFYSCFLPDFFYSFWHPPKIS